MEAFPLVKMYPNAQVSPEQFEILVMNHLKNMEPGIEILHRQNLTGVDGDYNIDISARFQKFGVNFLVIVECKHHKDSIKRDYVQLLKDKVDSIGAQKGILVSSSSFQSGALEYAKIHNIALIRLINEEFIYERRSKEYFSKPVPTSYSGRFVMKLIESTGPTSLTSKIIDDFNEVLGVSVK